MELKKRYGLKTAQEWLEAEWVGAFYLHDAPSTTYTPYCYAYDLGRLAREGLFFMENYNHQPAKHLTTFTDDVIEYVSNANCYTIKDEIIANERKKWEQEHLYSMLFASNMENETKDMLQTIFRLQEENKELCKKVGNLKKGLATEVKKREIAELKCKKS
jgi:hypothetical protein